MVSPLYVHCPKYLQIQQITEIWVYRTHHIDVFIMLISSALFCNDLNFSKLWLHTDLQLSETVREPSAGLYVVQPSYLGKYNGVVIDWNMVKTCQPHNWLFVQKLNTRCPCTACVKWWSLPLLISVPRGVYYFLSLTLSVCPDVCALEIDSSFFVSRLNRAIFWPSVQHVALYKMLFLDFWFRPPNAQNLLPKICTKSPVSRLVWQIDRRCMAPLWRHNLAPIVDDCSTPYMPL